MQRSFGGPFQKLGGAVDAALEIHGAVSNADNASYAMLVELLIARANAACQDDSGDMVSAGAAGHSYWGLVVNSRFVGPTFPGDYQVGPFQMLVKLQNLAHHINPRTQFGSGESHQAGTQ